MVQAREDGDLYWVVGEELRVRATYSYVAVISYCYSLKTLFKKQDRNFSKCWCLTHEWPLSSNCLCPWGRAFFHWNHDHLFPPDYPSATTTVFPALLHLSCQSFLPLQTTSEPAVRAKGRGWHSSLFFANIQEIVISVCWDPRLEGEYGERRTRINVRRVGLKGSDQSLASWICALNSHPLAAMF